ncbi:MAG: hypothetical protein K2K58_02505, partial [Muribaculaceae bacterium]|nr:hypothetical protein [Muribaculaceae bacterium]
LIENTGVLSVRVLLSEETCYYYPRGRVLFDWGANNHIIYADKCVSAETIEEVVELFEIEAYEQKRQL